MVHKNVRLKKKTLFLSLFSPTSSLTKLSYMPHPGPPTRTGYICCLGQPAGGAHFKEESLALKENTLWKPTGCCSIRSGSFYLPKPVLNLHPQIWIKVPECAGPKWTLGISHLWMGVELLAHLQHLTTGDLSKP